MSLEDYTLLTPYRSMLSFPRSDAICCLQPCGRCVKVQEPPLALVVATKSVSIGLGAWGYLLPLEERTLDHPPPVGEGWGGGGLGGALGGGGSG